MNAKQLVMKAITGTKKEIEQQVMDKLWVLGKDGGLFSGLHRAFAGDTC